MMQAFQKKLAEIVSPEEDYVWIHDYHLLVLPSLLRKKFYKLRIGLFLHSPFPSSEIFRTFPRRNDLLRCMLNADVIGAALAFSWKISVQLSSLWHAGAVDPNESKDVHHARAWTLDM